MTLSRFAGKKKAIILLLLPLVLSSIIFLLSIIVNNNFGILLIIFGPIFYPLLIYSLYPAFVRTEKFFSKRGYENVVLEYKFIKKILLVIIVLITIVLIIFYLIFFYQNNNTLTNNTLTNSDRLKEKEGLILSLTLFSGTLGNLASAAILRIITQNLKREFRFYFAKACCKIISGKNDEFEKMKYLFLLLTSYNRYLQRNLKIEINDIKKIYSIILYKDTNQQLEIIKSICASLEGDRLKLARYLSSLQKIPDSEFYVKTSIFEELKLIGAILVAIIPILISSITLLKELGYI